MKPPYLILGFLSISIISLAVGQNVPVSTQRQTPIETSVCKIVDDPSTYNNKLVRVRGYVQASFEYSVLLDEACSDNGIWFAFADGSAPPDLAVTVTGKQTPKHRDSRGRVAPPIPVRLIRDSNFLEFERYSTISAKGGACADEPHPTFPPDCTTYRVTATFIGRVDGVSKTIHAAHLKRFPNEPADWQGFGQMGMFDAQIVVQSVEKVVAEVEPVNRKGPSKSQ